MKTACVGMGNLLVWIFLVTNVFAQSISPDNRGGGTNNYDSPLYSVPDYGTNLWLSINLSNNAVHLLLHNTQPGVPYLIRSREDLISGSWFSETTVTGAVAATATPTILNADGRINSLFIQALTWMTNTSGGTSVMMAIGGERIMELTGNGRVISWDGNQYGELGDYTFLDSSNPVYAVGLTNIIRIAAGLNHSLALDANGTLWVWGQNTFGQLGNNDRGDSDVPVRVLGMTNVIAIAAHGYFGEGLFALSSAVKADGTVWIWGSSECFIGGGNSPVQVAGISNAIAVAIGNCQAAALLTNGTVWTWGDGNVPVPVSGLSNVVAICAGSSHTLALDSNGTVWTWGYNFDGELGDGEAENYSGVPVMVVGLTNVIGIAAGDTHSLAVDAQGNLWAWGDDSWGQLGDGGSVGSASLPFQVPGMTNIVSLAAGTYASAALDATGNLCQWGSGRGSGWPPWEWGDEKGYPGLAPTYVDFYNGQLPGMTILNGNNQTPHAGLEFTQPLVFQVTDANGATLSNAPVSVEVISGDMGLRTVSGGSNYKGLRLTTDSNGEVILIGYADRYISNPNCLVRVLAASRERIVEVDFTETLIPPPTISITSPADGSVCLFGTNQSLAITVNAQAAPGASIEEVDYYYQTNGGANVLLDVSTQSPYSFTWTNTLWWTSAFVGQYTISAVAVDNAGAQSDPQSVNITVALDSDGNGLPDYWQLQYFSHLGVDPDTDPDGDGISNLQEYQNGTDPTDYYNGNLPYLELLGGNDQAGNYDSFLPQPVSIKVSGSQFFTTSMANAPVTFTVTNGTALLAATTNDAPSNSIVLWSDSNSQISAWVYFPPAGSDPPDSTILVSASSGANSVAVTVNEFVPLGHWTFNNTNTWIGEAGQLPLLATNVIGIPDWSSNAVLVDSSSPARLAYNVVETSGNTNITCQTGSVLFWFKPDWNSANAGGNSPGTWGRLIEMGSYNPAFTNGWWALYLSPDGTQLLFGTSANGGGMTNLTANVSWYSNEWYQIALTYSPAGCALYVDGQLLANGAGVTDFLNAGELTNGFRIGSDQNGNNQAAGTFDELETFDYPLAAANTATYSSEIPDWWEVKYFGRAGMDPNSSPAGDGSTLLIDYQNGRDPNVINFSMSATNHYGNSSTVPVQINIQSGAPSCMAVAVNATNFMVVPSQPFDINSNFIAPSWQPYNSNIVVSLNSGDGDYFVWVGLRGLSHDASITWQGTRLTLDTTRPILTITNPANSVVSKPVIQLQGCANESLSSLTYDVSNASGVWTNQTGYVTGQFYDTSLTAFTTNWFQCYNVVLTSNGVNLITLHAADLAGNTASTNIVVTFDASANTNPPALTVIWPQSGTYISGSNFTLQAQVDDPMLTVSASIVDASGNTNIVQGLVEQSGLVWVQNLPLANGANTLTITAMDSAGNISATNLTLFQSAVIVTMNPLAGDQLNQPSVSVSGTVSDSGRTITVNGVTATINSDGTWEADNVPASSSGTAIFDVEVYSGSAPNLVRANLRFTPLDAPSGRNDGSHVFGMMLPVKIGLMSYQSKTVSSGVDYSGRYTAIVNMDGPVFFNDGDTINWDYQAGGFDQGYDYFSGYFLGSPMGGLLEPPKDSVWDFPLPAGQDAYSASGANISDAQDYVRTRVMIEPQGQAAAGTTVTYLVQAQAWNVNGGGPMASDSLQIRGVTLMPVVNSDGSVWGQTLISAPAGVNVDVTPMAPGNYTFNVQAQQLVDMHLAVDNNRDGQINPDNSDATTQINPYRFWINDSLEHGDDESSAGADDQIPGQPSFVDDGNGNEMPYANYANKRINGRSDLVNYFPVVLCSSNILQLLPPSDGYEYHLVQNDSAVKFVYTSLTPTNAFDYLTNLASTGYGANFDETVVSADTIQAGTVPGAVLDTNWLAQVQNNGGMGVILVESCAATIRPLWLEIWRNGKLLAGTPLYLSISGVEQMFRHVNFSYVNGTVTVPARTDAPNEPQTKGKNLMFLTGYNVNQQEARGVESEMFKRFYWSGSKAKFYGVTWNGAVSQGDVVPNITANFQTNVVNALLTAPQFANFINNLSGGTIVVAHSLGNMVVLSAISDYHAQPSKYFMLDSAVAMESVDGSVGVNSDMIHPDWADYTNRLYASSWFNLWPSADARSTLSWSNRLGNLDGVDIYNFYSSGEDVLRDFPGAPPDTISSSIADIISEWWQGTSVSSYVWVWQEKDKGRMSGNDFISSNHGGWGFNNVSTNYYWTIEGGDGGLESVRLDPANAALLPDSQLQTNAFFDMSVDRVLFTTDSSGSTYAGANRDRILSDAIPVLTLPVGANAVTNLTVRAGSQRNFDMQANFENGWPASRSSGNEASKWHHSDFDYVAYLFTHELFDKIVNDGNLK